MVTIDPLRIHLPPFPTQQHMDTTIAVAHAGSGDLPDKTTNRAIQLTGKHFLQNASGAQVGTSRGVFVDDRRELARLFFWRVDRAERLTDCTSARYPLTIRY